MFKTADLTKELQLLHNVRWICYSTTCSNIETEPTLCSCFLFIFLFMFCYLFLNWMETFLWYTFHLRTCSLYIYTNFHEND